MDPSTIVLATVGTRLLDFSKPHSLLEKLSWFLKRLLGTWTLEEPIADQNVLFPIAEFLPEHF